MTSWLALRASPGLRRRRALCIKPHMIPKPCLHIATCVALLTAVGCDKMSPTEPGNSTASFDGRWVGVKRLVSCNPAGPRCEFQPFGEQTYFSATFDQQGDAVQGSVTLSEPGPLALPYGFFLRGQVSSSAQLTFERVFTFDAGEPPYSGELSITRSLGRRLIGRMTQQPSTFDNITLVWEVEAGRR